VFPKPSGRARGAGRTYEPLPGSVASKAAKIIRFTVGGRLGHASISRAKSGSICVSRAKEWAKGKMGLAVTGVSAFACGVGVAGSIPGAST
jgi:hypothetical protein